MSSLTRRSVRLLVALLATSSVTAQPPATSIVVTRAWSRATVPGATVGAAYFEIMNSGPADALTAVECPVARRIELHSMATVSGMMQMRPVSSVDLPTKERVVFGPQGLHAMLVDLKRPLREGEHVPLTLLFRHADPVEVDALVEGLGAMVPPALGAVARGAH
jgi:copper(I)-binding protein